MNWSGIAIQRLKEYEVRQKALDNIPEQIATLEAKFTSIRAATTDGRPTGDNSNHREDALIYNIAAREELKNNLAIVKREIEITDRGLNALTKEEHRILSLFYVNRPRDYIARLCDELFIGQSELYRRKDDALRKFTRACYGIVEV